MAVVFISYRRDDSAGWAGRLATDLIERFGSEAVFQDIDAIEAGEDFVAAIERALGSCSAVLVLIGPDWSIIKGKGGGRRLDNPADTVRLEVAKSLHQEGLRVIPVLVGGAKMPDEDELPAELKPLAHRNALELSDKRWNYDLEKLAESRQDCRFHAESDTRPPGRRRYQDNASTCGAGRRSPRSLRRRLVCLTWPGKYEKRVRGLFDRQTGQ